MDHVTGTARRLPIRPSVRNHLRVADPLPFVRITDFLSRTDAERLLGKMIDRRGEFRPRGCNNTGHPAFYRMTSPLPTPPEFLCRFQDLAALLEEQFGVSLQSPEIELLGQAYNDGGSFAKHSDADAGGPNWRRRLSGVYYVHRRPKKFAGGDLAVYDDRGTRHLVEPDHNTVVFFSRDRLHEVLPVRCGSRAFEDSRFAFNVWIS